MKDGQKTFALGVGAQKCGTSWVHDYLASVGTSNFGFAKEYHIFDALHIEACKCFGDIAKRAVCDEQRKNRKRYNSSVQRLAFMENPELYFAYFKDLLDRDGVRLSGDFTPSYAGLPSNVLSEIKNEFEKRDIRVVPVFLMRDPVQRLHSMARMSLSNTRSEFSFDDEIAEVKKLHLSAQDVARSDYSHTLRNLDEVFGDDCFVGFYENIFTQSEINRLSKALQLDHASPDFGRKVNAGRQQASLPADLVAELRAGYIKTYESCIERFGANEIMHHWNFAI